MLARDHALSGALVFTAVSPSLHVTGTALLAGAVFTAGAATAPDIDEHGSTISRTLGFFTEAVSWVMHKISGGHRKGTHSILGLIVFTAAAWLAVHHLSGLTGKIVLGVILGVILSAGVRALQIGGHHGDLIGPAGAAAAVYWQAGLALVPLCIAFGEWQKARMEEGFLSAELGADAYGPYCRRVPMLIPFLPPRRPEIGRV